MSDPNKIRKDYYGGGGKKGKKRTVTYSTEDDHTGGSGDGKPRDYGWLVVLVLALVVGGFLVMAYLKR